MKAFESKYDLRSYGRQVISAICVLALVGCSSAEIETPVDRSFADVSGVAIDGTDVSTADIRAASSVEVSGELTMTDGAALHIEKNGRHQVVAQFFDLQGNAPADRQPQFLGVSASDTSKSTIRFSGQLPTPTEPGTYRLHVFYSDMQGEYGKPEAGGMCRVYSERIQVSA